MRIIPFIMLSVALCSHLRADQLRDAPITALITKAVPELSYVSGDKSWSGGYNTNAYIEGSEFDTNTCFAVLRASDSSLSAAGISVRVRDVIAKHFGFPTSRPSSTWEKKRPNNISGVDFGEAFLITFPPKNNRDNQGCHLSVQVVRRTSTEFGITIQYSTVAKQ